MNTKVIHFLIRFLFLFHSAFFWDSPTANAAQNEGPDPWRAPWLTEEPHHSAFLFPLVHDVKKNGRDLKDYHKIKAKHDIQKFVSRGLVSKSSSTANYSLDLTSLLGSYYINFTLGSENQVFSAIIDTGSPLLWVPCNCISCANTSAFLPLNPPYDPSLSTTSEELSCYSKDCETLANIGNFSYCSRSNQCLYQVNYASKALSSGSLISDTFNLQLSDSTVRKSRISFGCGMYQTREFTDGTTGLDGLIGMDRSQFSLQSQLASNGSISSEVSMCLGGYNGGYLALGSSSLPPMTYIPLKITDENSNYRNFYKIELAEVYVGSTRVSASDVKTSLIIDTGTSLTYLPPITFETILNLIENATGVKFETVDNTTYCSPLTVDNYLGIFSYAPILTLQFGNQTWSFSSANYVFFAYYDICLNLSPTPSGYYILGEIMMRNHYLHFDNTGNRFGYASVNCTTGELLDSIGPYPASAPSPFSSDPLSPLSFPSPPPPPPSSLSFPPPPPSLDYSPSIISSPPISSSPSPPSPSSSTSSTSPPTTSSILPNSSGSQPQIGVMKCWFLATLTALLFFTIC